jgi:hypothetical protein
MENHHVQEVNDIYIYTHIYIYIISIDGSFSTALLKYQRSFIVSKLDLAHFWIPDDFIPWPEQA